MSKEDYLDLQACCAVQPKRKYPHPSKAAKNLAEELLILLNYDQVKTEAILRELVRQSPNKSLEWYYEIAVYRLSKRKKIDED